MATNLGGLVKRLQDIMRNDPGINGDAQRIEQIIWALFLKVYDAKEEDWEMDEDDYHSIIPEPYRWQNWAHDDGTGTAYTGEELLEFVNELFTVLKNLSITPDMPKKKRIVKTMFEETNQYMKDGVLLRQVINVIDDINLESYDNMHALGDIYETILKELQSAGRANSRSRSRRPTTAPSGTTPSTASRRSSSPTCSPSRTCCCTASITPTSTTATACSTTSSTTRRKTSSTRFS